jgi:hypothetical protein
MYLGLHPGPVVAEAGAQNIGIDRHAVGSDMTVLIYSLSADKSLTTILIPLATFTNEGSLTLAELYAVDRQGRQIPVAVRDTHIQISGDTDLPSVFSLQGVYPNPFNPSTTISYEVTKSAEVTLVVYNLLGQEVVRLVEQQLQG